MNMHKEKTQNKRGEKSTEEETFKFVCLFERERALFCRRSQRTERECLFGGGGEEEEEEKEAFRRRRGIFFFGVHGCRREREGERRNGDI